MCQPTRAPSRLFSALLEATGALPGIAPAQVGPATAPAAAEVPSGAAVEAPGAGSRRRRLWELGPHAHCPVVGVCLPMGALRQLGLRHGLPREASDYEIHVQANSLCRQRGPLAEAIQKALDQRFDLTLRQARALKTREELAEWWQQQVRQASAWPAAFWSTLTHPRCDAALEELVLQTVHMLQHQAGATDRADWARLQALADENAVLTRALAAAQRRATEVSGQQTRRIEQLQAQAMQLRADILSRDTQIAALWDELRGLEQAHPGLPERQALAEEVAQLRQRAQDLQRQLTRRDDELARARQRAHEAWAELRQWRAAQPEAAGASGAAGPAHASAPLGPHPAGAPAEDAAERLEGRAVLCVGGRTGSVPDYRELVESSGARFLHHDGGVEDHADRLEATLAAADLVICQAGCVSHNAYWRVKSHCRRTGKPCVFIERPSQHALRQALWRLQPLTEVPAASAASLLAVGLSPQGEDTPGR
ncbi:DUF2325 domain-containing protein [Ideonella livida]|uniref:DUF2325 domain-containing protein n=1 Tax=Ideonella livida TaxID=2707176 RepID=A0A7C9TKE9_9BURK|nr:DUF2325 domain-containing protein [Ideonella livida]NDY91583.1 DUF2325 domain-containing protein [Ideonella livida]